MGKKTNTANLTNNMIDKLEPSDKAYDVRDSGESGFYIRVYPSGIKTFRYEYRRGKHYTIGRYNKHTFKVAMAREAIGLVRGKVSKGVDPNEEKKQACDLRQEKANQYTFNAFLEQKYKPWYRATHPKTTDATFQVLESNFKPLFGTKPLTAITLEKVEHWRSKEQLERRRVRIKKQGKEKVRVEEPIGAATLNRYIERLSAFLSKAVEYKYLDSNPLIGLKKLKVAEKNRVRFLSEKEFLNLLKALDDREEQLRAKRDKGNAWRKARGYTLYPDLRQQAFVDYLKPMVLISLGSGVRFGSLIRLEWERHVDSEDKDNVILKLTPDIVKTEKGYDVPLDENTSNILIQWYDQTYGSHQGKGWVFPGKKPGSHIANVKKSWNSLLELAGIEDFHWHDQRHDYASQHVMSGTDLYTVMELLGHTDPKMTKKYAHLASEHKIAAAKKLGKRREDILKKADGK